MDAIINAYKKDVDRSLLRENLKLTTQQRGENFVKAMRLVFELQRSAVTRRSHAKQLLGQAHDASAQAHLT